MSQSPSKADFLTRSIHTDTPVGRVIQTRYAGYKFRSRLEARWAVLFDALGLEWEYEPEGFSIGRRWYLPDFRVPEWSAWIECKAITERDNWAPHLIRLCDIARITHCERALVLFGPPDLMHGNMIAYYDQLTESEGDYDFLWLSGGCFELINDPNEYVNVTPAYRKAMEERFEVHR